MCDYVPPLQSSADSYNGASHENFSWSQTINDLDVLINIPLHLKNPNDLKIHVSPKEMKVETRKKILMTGVTESDDWDSIFFGKFSFLIKKNEVIWTMTPGKYVHVHLEKIQERWWEALIIGESKIQLDKIDCSRDIDELGQCEQMKLQELMWSHHEKISKTRENKSHSRS